MYGFFGQKRLNGYHAKEVAVEGLPFHGILGKDNTSIQRQACRGAAHETHAVASYYILSLLLLCDVEKDLQRH